MTDLSGLIKQADWKKEKHVPVIVAPDEVQAGELFEVKVSMGAEIAHPNTTEHHIPWISVYFHPEGGKFTHQLGHFEFSAHGEGTAGPNEGPAHTHHGVSFSARSSPRRSWWRSSGFAYASKPDRAADPTLEGALSALRA